MFSNIKSLLFSAGLIIQKNTLRSASGELKGENLMPLSVVPEPEQRKARYCESVSQGTADISMNRAEQRNSELSLKRIGLSNWSRLSFGVLNLKSRGDGFYFYMALLMK